MNPGRIFLSPPHMSGAELAFIQEAFDSNYIAPLGPMVDAFEREFAAYTGIKHCVAHIPTDLYGQRCDYDQFFSVCENYDGPVIVNAAEAMGGARCQKASRNMRANGRRRRFSPSTATRA